MSAKRARHTSTPEASGANVSDAEGQQGSGTTRLASRSVRDNTAREVGDPEEMGAQRQRRPNVFGRLCSTHSCWRGRDRGRDQSRCRGQIST